MGGNEEQIAFWNGEAGDAWARRTAFLDRMLAELTEAVLDAAGVGSGDRVLDLGCGGGGAALEAARRVGPMGSVTAIDVSAPMLAVARGRAAAAAADVAFVMGDAASYPFAEGSLDAVVSRLGAMFFEDPAAAFARLRRALAPGGRLALGVWRGPRENPWAMAPVSAARPFVDMPPRPGPEDPGPFSLADPGRVRRLLEAAGLAETALASLDCRLPLGGDIDEALAFACEVGPLAEPLARAGSRSREKARAAVAEVLEASRDGDGEMGLGGACWIATARAP